MYIENINKITPSWFSIISRVVIIVALVVIIVWMTLYTIPTEPEIGQKVVEYQEQLVSDEELAFLGRHQEYGKKPFDGRYVLNTRIHIDDFPDTTIVDTGSAIFIDSIRCVRYNEAVELLKHRKERFYLLTNLNKNCK